MRTIKIFAFCFKEKVQSCNNNHGYFFSTDSKQPSNVALITLNLNGESKMLHLFFVNKLFLLKKFCYYIDFLT